MTTSRTTVWTRRRSASAVLALTLTAGALGTGALGFAPQVLVETADAAPAAKATIRTVDAVVGDDRAIRVGVRCTVAKCTGKVTVKVAGVGTVKKSYRLAKGRNGTVTLKLSAAQARKVSASPRRGVITVTRKVGKKTKKVTRKVEVKAATVSLGLTTTAVTVGHDHVAVLTVKAGNRAAFAGTVALTVGGKGGSGTQTVRLAKGASKTLRFALADAQVAALGTGAKAVTGAVRVVETSPERTTRTLPLTLKLDHEMVGGDGHGDGHGGGHGDGHEETPIPAGQSSAYARGWNPTAYDTCTRAEHESYAVIGVDGLLYPSWHPAVHTRTDGTTCTFGHEHGDDPRNSDIFDWVVSEYQKQNDDANGVPFGYGSEQLTNYANATNTNFHRHEDDPGHKVVVANDQKMGVTFTDRWGDRDELTCDTLIKAHQGSHSSDATKNNTHELVYALSCNDGAKLLTTVMTNYGNSNELQASCTRPFTASHGPATTIATKGSTLPQGEGGGRLIPTLDCIEEYVTNGTESGAAGTAIDDRRGSPNSRQNGWWWAGYEQWQAFSSIETVDGKEIARFEPWFGLQNPARYYTHNTADNTAIGDLNTLAWEEGPHQQWSPWKELRAASPDEPITKASPQAWFKGDIRDAWLTTTKIDNRDATSTVVQTNPWGKDAQEKPFIGSIRTVISRTSNTDYVKTTTPSVINRSVRTAEALTREGASAPLTMGFFYDYGRDMAGNKLGVHAPN